MHFEYTCERCGEVFYRRYRSSKKSPHKFCSRKCRWPAPPRSITGENGTVLIPLTQGKYATIDAGDEALISEHKWHVFASGYACRNRKKSEGAGQRYSMMHREIMDAPDDAVIDHINGDKLDNRRANLRLATPSQNMANYGPRKDNKSGFKGVHYITPPKKRWVSSIKVNGKRHHIGHFHTAEEAARAYDETALRLLGDFAWLNFPEEHR